MITLARALDTVPLALVRGLIWILTALEDGRLWRRMHRVFVFYLGILRGGGSYPIGPVYTSKLLNIISSMTSRSESATARSISTELEFVFVTRWNIVSALVQ
jgi:hypothetical protein